MCLIRAAYNNEVAVASTGSSRGVCDYQPSSHTLAQFGLDDDKTKYLLFDVDGFSQSFLLEHAYNKVRHQFSLLFKLAIHFSRLAMDTETCTPSVGGAALIPAFVVVTNEIPLTFATSH